MTTELVRRRYTIRGKRRVLELGAPFWNAMDIYSKAMGMTTKQVVTMLWDDRGKNFTAMLRHHLVVWLLEQRDKHRSRLPTERPWRPR